jgi:hypothetical protein
MIMNQPIISGGMARSGTENEKGILRDGVGF